MNTYRIVWSLVWIKYATFVLIQLFMEMQRLIEDTNLTDSSLRSWKAVLPNIFKQIKLETVYNRRLHVATSDLTTLENGIYVKARL